MRLRCPSCLKSFTVEGPWRAHLLAELAIEEGVATVSTVIRDASAAASAANKIKKDLDKPSSSVQSWLQLSLPLPEVADPFGDWT